ncbi:MAG: ABC transporter permease [Candidatus Omnitrophica bacterium]|nr:ABC transporter permease [Candidatus Omnitrophota bacterium]MBU4477883.1 ABC transporter permease [Candidatus Omnitrophota bacterium]MCG2703738.1 ABC transporter permease [Candidatus Omnitrophota bacterium]
MKSFYLGLKELYDFRNLIIVLAIKEVKIRYKSAVLGWVWSLLNPLLLMLIFTVIFSFIFPVGIEKFPVFLLCALFPWFFFSTSFSQTTTSIVENASLLKKASFPCEVIPLSIIGANLLNFVIALLLLFVFLLFSQSYPTWYWLYIPLIILLETIFVAGICFAAAALHTMFRDVKYAVELTLLVWFYATPIFYPLSFVPERIRPLFFFNPLGLFAGLYRDILLYGKCPDILVLGIITVIAFLSSVIGWLVFQRYKKFFVDVT